MEQSNGHIMFISRPGEIREFFIRNDTLFIAPAERPVMPDGYRCGRWECPLHLAVARVDMALRGQHMHVDLCVKYPDKDIISSEQKRVISLADATLVVYEYVKVHGLFRRNFDGGSVWLHSEDGDPAKIQKIAQISHDGTVHLG